MSYFYAKKTLNEILLKMNKFKCKANKMKE